MKITSRSPSQRAASSMLCALNAIGIACSGLLLAPSVSAVDGTVMSPVSFEGSVTGRTVVFSIYLPPGYSGGTEDFPVVYHLHGIGGRHDGPQINSVPTSHEEAVALGLIEPVIIVFPDGYTDSFWADSFDGAKPAETNVMLELLPHVDAYFRTRPTREWRAIQGFSMGGFGAAKFAAKYPDQFSACVIYDGAMLDWATVQSRHPIQTVTIFNSSGNYFDQFSPWHWVTQHAEVLIDFPFRQVVGALGNENDAFHAHLVANSVTPEFIETGCAHVLPCVLDGGGDDSWALISRSFGETGEPTPTTVTFASIGTEDGWVPETSETSGAGGTPGAAGPLRIGDGTRDQQFRLILSFDTSGIPDDATIVSATLSLRRSSVVGSNPFGTHGSALVDIRNGNFGAGTALAAGDFQAAASAAQVGGLSNPTSDGAVASAAISPAGLLQINKGAGRTQLRVSFSLDDNDDLGNDFVNFFPGENATASNRPMLAVTYE